MVKRILKILALLLIAAAAVMYYLKNQSEVTAWLMLFNQNSTQVLQGRIGKAENPVGMALFLSAFHGAVMPWKSNPRIAVACAAVFGLVPGMLICLAGRLIAVFIWFVIGWLLVGISPKKLKKYGLPAALLYGGVCCFAPTWAAPIALLCGALSLPLVFVLLAALLVHIPAMGFYAKFASVYSSILPAWCGTFMYVLGAALIIGSVILFIIKRKK